MSLHAVNHPLVRHNLGLLRQESTPPAEFRMLVRIVCRVLAIEATRDLPLEHLTVGGWAGPVDVERCRQPGPTIVPILRAGLGMQEGFLDVVPDAPISLVGVFRNENNLQPVHYLTRLVPDIARRTAIILDPMLATGGSLCAAVDILKKAGCRDIRGLFLVAAPEGLQRMEREHPDVALYVAAVDERLDEHGYILPGLGDAGDRIFGTA